VLDKRIRLLVPTTGTTLTEIFGVGPLVAAQIIGEVRCVERFATQDRFARHNGTAPIPASSGRSTRYRLNRGNNRRLNHAIHVIALTQAGYDPWTARLRESQAGCARRTPPSRAVDGQSTECPRASGARGESAPLLLLTRKKVARPLRTDADVPLVVAHHARNAPPCRTCPPVG
jgi:hypothetical protein